MRDEGGIYGKGACKWRILREGILKGKGIGKGNGNGKEMGW